MTGSESDALVRASSVVFKCRFCGIELPGAALYSNHRLTCRSLAEANLTGVTGVTQKEKS